VPTIFSHSIAAVALGTCCPTRRMPLRFWVLAAVCAALPDADVLGFGLGVRYSDLLGHRGLTHSLFFALALGFLVVTLFFRNIDPGSGEWWILVAYFFIVTASHGVLDAMTNGGLGVAFFSPFSNERYFFPWRPIEVSPLSVGSFLSSRGAEVIVSEIKWIWIPSGLVILIATLGRRLFRTSDR
jgi:inner membrane protein